jgi:hypothetical protein
LSKSEVLRFLGLLSRIEDLRLKIEGLEKNFFDPEFNFSGHID